METSLAEIERATGRRVETLAPPPGFRLYEDAITAEEERAVTLLMDDAGLSHVDHPGTGDRSNRAFGLTYDVARDLFEPTEPLPPALEPLRARAARLVGEEPAALAQAMLLRYEPGATIPFHFDKPIFEHIIGVSLGTASIMCFRNGPSGDAYAAAPLPPRSMYVMAGDARHVWQHSVPPVAGVRWSITFRSISDAGRAWPKG